MNTRKLETKLLDKYIELRTIGIIPDRLVVGQASLALLKESDKLKYSSDYGHIDDTWLGIRLIVDVRFNGYHFEYQNKVGKSYE
jgi:hypothetical protein